MKLDFLADISFARLYLKGEVIIRENDSGSEIFYILSGIVGVYKDYQQKDEVQIAALGTNEFFGEMTLFLNKRRSATVVALEDTEVLIINDQNSLSLFKPESEIAMIIISSLCKRLTKLNSTYSKLHREFKLDSFTKLYNRATFDTILSDSVEQFNLGYNRPFSLLILDIDRFKNINDTYGHDFGDIVILTLVNALRGGIRSSDRAFRFGGEEFAVIIPENQKIARVVAERIRTEFEKKTYIEHPECQFTVSIGICEVSENITPLQLFQYADEALLLAKSNGRNCVVVYDRN